MPTIISNDGTEIFYKDWGSGQPVVFSHGWPLSSDDWDNQMLFFVEHGYRVIAHDRRGHGRSAPAADGHDMDHYADDLAAVTARLDLHDAIHVGHSTGGGEVIRYLGRHGESRVAKAAIMSAVPAPMVLTGTTVGSPSKNAPYEALIRNWWRQSMMGAANAAYLGMVAFSQTDFSEDLKKITVPVMIMHGDDDQATRWPNSAPLSAELLHHGILKTYPGHRHVPTTQHATINADLLTFFRS
ncbi:alpha/beta hydrolase [Actinoplanes sp. TBRC 11911]|uniref:alpha/beta fold hydrolase n=1 Tax=Actinoplanes sp. TBRC 11911 TaxID=2729386 RepID=UPI00145C7EDD|nr:alpha/beta hydrolase [Actinoplanes sp. TBRC 11911]NMO52917.1 alpha/beta hydrolase [Actinoplanes sp. TBRC 11911]